MFKMPYEFSIMEIEGCACLFCHDCKESCSETNNCAVFALGRSLLSIMTEKEYRAFIAHLREGARGDGCVEKLINKLSMIGA